MSKSFLNNHSVRGLRNNNPGNLKRSNNAWQGKIPYPQSKDKTFEQFTELKWGLRAMVKDIVHDINKGKNTVRLLISEYAPSSENNTQAYIDSVCKTMGIQPNDKLTTINDAFIVALVRSILKVELGTPNALVTDADIYDALTVLGEVSTPILKVTINKFKQFAPLVILIGFFFLVKFLITPKKTQSKWKK
jgi:hypothetical protein